MKDCQVEEITGYANGEVVFKMHNGILTYGSIEDCKYVISKMTMNREQLERFKDDYSDNNKKV